jgi:hypothetical protein
MIVGHHHTYVRPKLKSSAILSDGPVKYILRPGGGKWGTAPQKRWKMTNLESVFPAK